jgi:outer membrane protein OmpA-like peptidoglycan-associated protein
MKSKLPVLLPITLLAATLFTTACTVRPAPPPPPLLVPDDSIGEVDGAAQGAVKGSWIGTAIGAAIGLVTGPSHNDGERVLVGADIGNALGTVIGASIGAVQGKKVDQQIADLQDIPGLEVDRRSPKSFDLHISRDHFDPDSLELTTDSRQMLHEVAANFRHYDDDSYVIEAHAEDGGTEPVEFKAQAVRDELVRDGVDADHIHIVGKNTRRHAHGCVEIHVEP